MGKDLGFPFSLQKPSVKYPEHVKKFYYNLNIGDRVSSATRSPGTIPPQPTILILVLSPSSVMCAASHTGSHVELRKLQFQEAPTTPPQPRSWLGAVRGEGVATVKQGPASSPGEGGKPSGRRGSSWFSDLQVFGSSSRGSSRRR